MIDALFQRLETDTVIAFKKFSYLFVAVLLVSIFLVPQIAESTGYINLSTAFPMLVIFILIPAMDTLVGLDTFNINKPEDIEKLDKAQGYRIYTLLILPVVLFMQFWAAHYYMTTDMSVIGSLVWIISIGIVAAGLGINVGHDLIHKSEKIESWTGGLLLASVCYGGFKVEHVRGHHVNVSTPSDATSAKFNQNLYHFLPRAYWHNFIAAFKLEAKRLKNKGHSWLNWRNELFWWYGFSALLAVTFFAIWGFLGLFFFLAQSFVAFTVLEMINYVEHYGLRRRLLENGRYERPKPEHSWNSSYFLSNMLLFQLQRHSDHHANPKRRYQNLRHYDDVPQLPMGYPLMLLITTIPPLWFKIMNPRVEAFYGDETFYKE